MLNIIIVFSLLLAVNSFIQHHHRFGSSLTKNNVKIMKLMAEPSNEEIMEGWITDMIYSGDMEGYVRRFGKDILCEEFVEYLGEKIETADDEDERQTMNEVLSLIEAGVKSTDGLGQDSTMIFENRLNQILFTAPNQRKTFIEENLSDISDGFVQYTQETLMDTTDTDSKVVIASILKMIGEVKGVDLLGGAESMLQFADKSLGDDFDKTDVALEDALAEAAAKGNTVGDRNERILAALMFSQRDILEDVLNNLHEIDERFVEYLDEKIATCDDIEERVALSSLKDTVVIVLEKVNEVQGTDYDDVNQKEEELEIGQLRQRMQEVQMGVELSPNEVTGSSNINKVFEVQTDKKDSFLSILDRFVNRPVGQSIEECVEENYELADYEFMEMLKNEITTCLNEGADIEAEQYTEILSTITATMAKRIGSAQERLQNILSKGHPKAMESEIVAMARKNEIDEALVLLMEANMQQAEQAGAAGEGAVQVLKALINRANGEREKGLPDEQRLLRALLKNEISEERKGLLYEAFKPVKSMNEEGEFEEGDPLIKPPMFIRVVRQFIRSFGNVDSFNIMGRAQTIVAEAQEVATELYGEGMSTREQQMMMWDKKTVSVWDLGNFEEQAMMSGEEIPWSNDKYDNMSPEEVLGERVRKVGGDGDLGGDISRMV